MKSIMSILRSSVVLILMVILLIMPPSSALADTEGPNNPAFGTNVTGIGSETWVDPGNITETGSPYTTVVLYHGHRYSNYLQGTQYGFAIPADAAITGIEVTINRMSSSRNPNVLDNVVSLVKGGVIVGDNKALTLDAWPTELTLATYGDAIDLWGTTWTPDEINSLDFGIVLAAVRDNNGNNSRAALVDTMQITVYYEFTSVTSVDCGDGVSIMYGDSVTCVATVSRIAGDLTPSGTVTWNTAGSGSFEPNPCIVTGADGTATCATTYTPSTVGTGAHLVTATYDGDGYFTSSNDSQTVNVLPRPITVTADTKTKLYRALDPQLTYQITDGSLVFGDTFTGTLTRETGEDAGLYAILQGTLALPIDYDLTYIGDYLTITKAYPVCDISPYDVTYDGNAYTASGVCTGVLGEILSGLNLSGTTHTEAGNYTDAWTFTDVTGNYFDANGTVEDSIGKADAICEVNPYNELYDSNPHTATGACTGVLGEDLTGLDLSGTVHTDAGNYTDSWIFVNVNYSNQSGTIEDVITKADVICSIDPYEVTFDGTTHTATGTCTGVDGEPLSGLDLTDTTHLNVGIYSDTWTFTDQTGNYNDLNGTVEDIISKADAICEVTAYDVTYDGEAHTATGVCNGVNGEPLNGLDLDPTTHTNAGLYSDNWTFTDQTGNYNDQNDTVVDNIGKADAICVVTPYLVEYDRQAHTSAGICTGVMDENLVGLDLTGTTHTEINTYPGDPWTFTDITGNYNNLNGSVTDDITLRAIIITADAKSKSIGQIDPQYTFQLTSGTLLSGDWFSGWLTRQPGESVGTYPILQGTLSLPNYYVITYVGADLTITGARYLYPMMLMLSNLH